MESLDYFYTGGAMFDIIAIIGTLDRKSVV